MEGFITPPEHIRFSAKKLFGAIKGHIADGSVAYLEPNGGGPQTEHTHPHDHLFFVIRGEATLLLGEEKKLLRENESFLVKGTVPHSVWNESSETTVMVGITVIP